jgi:hypothetical protein
METREEWCEIKEALGETLNALKDWVINAEKRIYNLEKLLEDKNEPKNP